MTSGPYDLSKTPIHLQTSSEAGAVPVADFSFDGPSFERYTADYCTDGGPGRLMMIEESPVNWPAWECHTQGDEVVFVLAGSGTFIQQSDEGEVRLSFAPGSAIINPRGVWHTADVDSPMRAIYLTPCAGTEHRPR